MATRRRNPVRQQIRTIRKSLRAIDKALRALAQLGPTPRRGRAGSSPRRKLTLSPQRRASLKLQGAYMGHLRGLKPRDQARVKALKAASGYPKAIALAKRLSRG
jgi:hypothetical protein